MPSGQKTKTQHIKQKPYCNKFHKDLKMVHIKTILKKDDEAGKANRVTGVNRKKPNRVLLHTCKPPGGRVLYQNHNSLYKVMQSKVMKRPTPDLERRKLTPSGNSRAQEKTS